MTQLHDLDRFIDMLYESSSRSKQVDGINGVLKLCFNILNLEELIQNSVLMGALTRILQEEYKKSVEVSFNVLKIFLAFSNFTEMHDLIAEYKIGVLTMKIVEYERKRIETQTLQLKEFEEERTVVASDGKIDSRIQEKQKSEHKKRAHEKTLFVAIKILQNLAVDTNTEKKMTKKGLLLDLIALVDPSRVIITFPGLICAVATLLSKLVTTEDNVEVLRDSGLIGRLLSPLLTCNHSEVINSILNVLINLAFDIDLRAQITMKGHVPLIISLLSSPSTRTKAARLLYLLSYDNAGRDSFAGEGVGQLAKLLGGSKCASAESGSLVVNISLADQCVQYMTKPKLVGRLVEKLAAATDEADSIFVLKVLRNMAAFTYNISTQQMETESDEGSTKLEKSRASVWSPHVKTLVDLAEKNSSNHAILYEYLAIIGSMTTKDVPSWPRLLRDGRLLVTVSRLLTNAISQSQPDVTLEAVLVLSAAAVDAQACELIARSDALPLAYQLFKNELQPLFGKKCDTEILLQLLYLFHRLLQHDAACQELMCSTQIVADMIECLKLRHPTVRRVCVAIVDKFIDDDCGGELVKPLIKARFEALNSRWVEAELLIDTRMGYGDNRKKESGFEWHGIHS